MIVCCPSTTAVESCGPLEETMVEAAAKAMPRPASRLTPRRMSPERRERPPSVVVADMNVVDLSYWAVAPS